MFSKSKPFFSLGQTVATPACLAEIEKAGQTPAEFFARHQCGDWGSIFEEDHQANEQALENGDRLMSVYQTKFGEKIWCITEWDRSVSTLLRPSEY